jgi:hypothetical protein
MQEYKFLTNADCNVTSLTMINDNVLLRFITNNSTGENWNRLVNSSVNQPSYFK